MQQQSWKVDVDQKVEKVALLWGVVVFIGVPRIVFQLMRLSQSRNILLPETGIKQNVCQLACNKDDNNRMKFMVIFRVIEAAWRASFGKANISNCVVRDAE
ncbi:hypothetical protein [Pseudomonas fluorescens]